MAFGLSAGSIIGLGSAVLGAGSSILGASQKASGVAQNKAAQDAITAQLLANQADEDKTTNDIANWYNGATSNLFSGQTLPNQAQTTTEASPAAFQANAANAEASRTASGNAVLNGVPNPANYSDNAPDSTGAVKAENARQLVNALDLGQARVAAGAKVNSYGDALQAGGLAIAHGTQRQAAINAQQATLDKIDQLRTTLNTNTHTPVLSPSTMYSLAQGAGSGDFNTGSALMAGGSVANALGAYGVPQKAYNYFNGLFGSIPTPASQGISVGSIGGQPQSYFTGP